MTVAHRDERAGLLGLLQLIVQLSRDRPRARVAAGCVADCVYALRRSARRSSCVSLSVCLRMQVSNPHEFHGISKERAYADYVVCNVILFFVVFTFIG